jgi:zinc D-Ala-D-Ala carboxypeptidase
MTRRRSRRPWLKWLLLAGAILGVLLLATRNVWRASPAGDGSGAPRSAPQVSARCAATAGWQDQARRNAQGFRSLQWAPFGVPEAGWDAYWPAMAKEIGTACAPATAGFAAALAAWQKAHGLPPTGEVEPKTIEAMRIVWMLRRPFVQVTRSGACPPAAAESSLATATAAEGYWGKLVQLRPGALAAYRDLRAAALREVPEVAREPRLLTLISGYRAPDAGAGSGGGGPARASCSAHRTGLAVDLNLGSMPGADPTSSTDANRSYQAATPAHRWLAANADRFGFVAYPYEPWHWEWTGEAVAQ